MKTFTAIAFARAIDPGGVAVQPADKQAHIGDPAGVEVTPIRNPPLTVLAHGLEIEY